MKKLSNAMGYIRKNGLCGFIREFYYRLSDIYYEKYFNVSTKGRIMKEELDVFDKESLHYSSVHYKHIMNTLRNMPGDISKSTLIDYGCGKGRAIISAASFHFKQIIGVEISRLSEVSQWNVDRMKHRKTKDVKIVQCNALSFQLPSETNIIYFYNPFKGSILETVTKNIYSSYKDTPRKIYIIYFNNDHFDKIVSNQDWLIKTEQAIFHPNFCCGIYETRH